MNLSAIDKFLSMKTIKIPYLKCKERVLIFIIKKCSISRYCVVFIPSLCADSYPPNIKVFKLQSMVGTETERHAHDTENTERQYQP